MFIAAQKADFAGAWTTFWSSISGSLGTLPQLATTIGLILLLSAIVKFFWDKRRGGGGGGRDNNTLIYTVVIATILTAPEVILPIILKVVDIIINAVLSAFK